MAQFKIYGHAAYLSGVTGAISDVIHHCAVEVFGLPSTKRFHRFFPMEEGNFLTPTDRSERYIIIECVLFEGRAVERKKAFYTALLAGLERSPGVDAQDIEMTFLETPRHDWLIRGKPGDELELPYKVQG